MDYSDTELLFHTPAHTNKAQLFIHTYIRGLILDWTNSYGMVDWSVILILAFPGHTRFLHA